MLPSQAQGWVQETPMGSEGGGSLGTMDWGDGELRDGGPRVLWTWRETYEVNVP